MSISINTTIRFDIMHGLEDLAESRCEPDGRRVENSSGLDLYDIESVIYDVLHDHQWVSQDDLMDAAVGLAEDFDGVDLNY